MKKLIYPIYIMGAALRTTNDNAQAFTDIPAFWERFLRENYAAKIPHRLSDDIYAVYTDFENAGKNNQGMYTLIIGYNVDFDAKPLPGLTAVTIPAGDYRIFSVEHNRQDQVGAAWQAIWAIPNSEKQGWSFTCEFERYRASGEIDIFIGLKY